MTNGSRRALLALLVALSCARAFGDSKVVEAELRARLAATEAERVAAVKGRDDAIARLNAATTTRSRSEWRSTAAAVTAANALAQDNADAAAQAAISAQVGAAIMRTQISELQKRTERNGDTMILTEISGFAIVLLGFIYKALVDMRDRRWALKDLELHRESDLKDKLEHRRELMTKVAEVREEAHAAYEEANTVNNKIATIGLRTNDGSKLSLGIHSDGRAPRAIHKVK